MPRTDQRWSHDLTIIKQVESRGISSGCPVSDVSIRSDVDRVFGIGYPFATKIAAGKIDAVTGKPCSGDLAEKSPKLCCHSNAALARRILRQGRGYPAVCRDAVRHRLHRGRTITGQAERGGLQIQVYPMRPEIYENEIKTKVLGGL